MSFQDDFSCEEEPLTADWFVPFSFSGPQSPHLNNRGWTTAVIPNLSVHQICLEGPTPKVSESLVQRHVGYCTRSKFLSGTVNGGLGTPPGELLD